MFFKSAGTLAAALFAGAALAADAPKAAPTEACLKLGTEVTAAAQANPGGVVALVSTKLAASPECACEIVKGAIKGAKADETTTGSIVEAAVKIAPKQTKLIVECAVIANPKAAAQIRAALQRVFGGKDGKGGKIVEVTAPKTLNPAVLISFILDGIPPSAIGNTPGLTAGLASNAATGGGVFNFPSAIPGIPAGGVEEEGGGEQPKPPGHPPVHPTTPTNPIPKP